MNRISGTVGANDQTGYVFDIQHYSIHDGPGIRTTVFLSGCPLRCMWCQNPESYSMKPRLSWREDACTGCGRCIPACPRSAILRDGGKMRTDRALCSGCGNCVPVCEAEARSLIGSPVTASHIMSEVLTDKVFYDGSGGGVTLSGGEVFMQPMFAETVLRLCREKGIHTTIETSGYADRKTEERVLAHTDLVLHDLKHMDPERHQEGTGVSNGRILESLRFMVRDLRIPVIVRIPVIPGFNDSEEHMGSAADFVAGVLSLTTPVHLLPYHRMGSGKRAQLGLEPATCDAEPPAEERMERLRMIFESRGLPANIGG